MPKVHIVIVGVPKSGKTIIANMIEMMFAEHGKGIAVNDPDHHQYKMPLNSKLVQDFCDNPALDVTVTTRQATRHNDRVMAHSGDADIEHP